MPSYNVLKSDGTTLATVTDLTINSTASTIKFIGRNIVDYGQDIAENQVHIMENFANTTEPVTPVAGQLWWDTNINILKVYDGANFDISFLQNIVEDTTPQLGGQLDVNTFGLGDGTNLLLDFVEDASAVNYIQIENEATGSGPIIRSVGADTNIDLHITAKGAGIVNLGSGGVKLNADLDANNNSITNLAAPSGSNDVATKDYVDNNHGLDNVVEDLTPQLGGNLFAGAFGVTTGNGELVLSFSTDGEGAINWIDIAAALTGTGPTIGAFGSDTNIDLVLDTKGTGDIDVSTNKIVNVGDPTLAQDVATKNYVDNEISTVDAGNLDNVVEDTTPQLGGQLDVNGNGLGDGTNLLLDFVEDASAVNYIQIENEATGSGPTISAFGSDTNVDLVLDTKGTGDIDVSTNKIVNLTDPTASSDAATKDYVDNSVGFDLGEFTVAGLPTASSNTNGWALATDASGGRTVVRSDGTDWKVVAVEGATVTV